MQFFYVFSITGGTLKVFVLTEPLVIVLYKVIQFPAFFLKESFFLPLLMQYLVEYLILLNAAVVLKHLSCMI